MDWWIVTGLEQINKATDRVSNDQDTVAQSLRREGWQAFDGTNGPHGNRRPDIIYPHQRTHKEVRGRCIAYQGNHITPTEVSGQSKCV